MAVDHFHLFRVRPDDDGLVIILHFLQFRGLPAVREDDAVAAEDPVRRPVIPVTAIGERFLSPAGGQALGFGGL